MESSLEEKNPKHEDKRETQREGGAWPLALLVIFSLLLVLAPRYPSLPWGGAASPIHCTYAALFLLFVACVLQKETLVQAMKALLHLEMRPASPFMLSFLAITLLGLWNIVQPNEVLPLSPMPFCLAILQIFFYRGLAYNTLRGREEDNPTPFAGLLRAATVRACCLAILFALVLTVCLWQFLGLQVELPRFFLLALFLVAPYTLFFAPRFAVRFYTQQVAKQGAQLLEPEAIEALAKTNAIVFGRSEVLTEGRPFLANILIGGLTEDGLLSLAAAAENGSDHPLGKAIMATAVQRRLRLPRVSAIAAVPGKGVEAISNGRPIRVGKLTWLEEEGVKVNAAILTQADQAAAKGKEVVYVATGDDAKGAIVFTDELRPETLRFLQMVEEAGIHPILLTGEGKTTTKRLARDARLNAFRANLDAKDKATEIRRIQSLGQTVTALLGTPDDADPFQVADARAALYATQKGASLSIVDKNPQTLWQAIHFARKTLRRLKGILALAYICLLAAMLFIVYLLSTEKSLADAFSWLLLAQSLGLFFAMLAFVRFGKGKSARTLKDEESAS